MYKLFIFIFFVSLGKLIDAQKTNVDVQDDAVYFMEGKDSILIYQIEEKSLNGMYKRCNEGDTLGATKNSIVAAIEAANEISDETLNSVRTALHNSVEGAKGIRDEIKK